VPGKRRVDSYLPAWQHVTVCIENIGYVMDAQVALRHARGKPYAETFRCPAGQLSLDFCNTGQGARNANGSEWLADYDDLAGWLRAAGALSDSQAGQLRRIAAGSPKAAREVWQRALRFRDALFNALHARVHGRPAKRDDLALIEAEHLRSAPHASLSWDGSAYAWSLDASLSDLDATMQPLAESALQMLTSPRLDRLSRCGNETCHWLFLDETRNRSRRWCEMASCGNLLKVRRHRERRRLGR